MSSNFHTWKHSGCNFVISNFFEIDILLPFTQTTPENCFFFFLSTPSVSFSITNHHTHLMLLPVIALLPPAITLYIAVKAVWTSQKKPEQQLRSGPSGQFASKQWQHPSCQQLCLLLDTSVNSHLWFLIISTFMARLLCCDSPKNWPKIKKNS